MRKALLRKLRPRTKVWLEFKGIPVFGDGKAELLAAIKVRGSISGAAKAVGMSYRAVWGRLRKMEERLGVRLVARHAGGKAGGGSALTPAGEELLERYREFRDGLNELVDARFKQVFEAG